MLGRGAKKCLIGYMLGLRDYYFVFLVLDSIKDALINVTLSFIVLICCIKDLVQVIICSLKPRLFARCWVLGGFFIPVFLYCFGGVICGIMGVIL